MTTKLLFPWIIIIETIALLLCVAIAYSSSNEAIESAVGPHLLHIVTISVLLITFVKPSKEARAYARVYAWTNVVMDNIALFLMLFRYSQSENLKLGTADTTHFILYIISVLFLVMIDVHNVTFSWTIEDLPTTQSREETPTPAVNTPALTMRPKEFTLRPRTLPRVYVPPLRAFPNIVYSKRAAHPSVQH